jgi:hypothetical protein
MMIHQMKLYVDIIIIIISHIILCLAELCSTTQSRLVQLVDHRK